MRYARFLSLLLIPVLAGCPGGSKKQEDPVSKDDGPTTTVVVDDASGEGTGTVAAAIEEGPIFRLADGVPQNGPLKTVPQAKAKPLGDDETNSLLGRLPKLEDAETKSFAKRKGPPPPERTGATISKAFPPKPKPPTITPPAPGPLKVARFQPEGDVPLAPHLSLTFSQPMVAVASVGDLAAQDVPAKLTPQPPGRWRWLGTQTLVFEPEGERFPMATEYTVSVPAGTASASGAKLERETRWSFRTPTVNVISVWPSRGPQDLEPTFVVNFDQRVDPDAVLATISVDAAGQDVDLRLASAEETAKSSLRAREGRSVVFKAKNPLPGDSPISVTVGPGTPSAEGPRTSNTPAKQFGFRTYAPLMITGHRAGYGKRCPPGAPFTINFNNPLDVDSVEDAIVFEPEIPGMQVHCYGNNLQIRGATKARTTYTGIVQPNLRDRFGQTYGKDTALEFTTTSPSPRLQGLGNSTIILDPAGKPRFTVRSIAIDELLVRVHAVTPKDWQAFNQWRGSLRQKNPRPMPGREVFDDEVDVDGSMDEWVETHVDVSKALKGGVGHAVIYVEPVDWEQRWKPRVAVWVQSTRLGLDVQSDPTDLLAWVTDLRDGKPVAGADVTLNGDSRNARGTTNDAGLATIGLPGRTQWVVARKGQDSVLLPGYWRSSQRSIGLRWFTFDDRHLYRPKETVTVKGWVRRYDHRKGGDVLPLGNGRPGDHYQAYDARGRKFAEGKVSFDEFGGFSVAFPIPDDVHVGQARVQFSGHNHMFRIAEFRRPEFEVTVAPDSPGPHFAGGSVVLTTTARYFAGGGLPGAPVRWTVSARKGSFTPPGRRDYVFGEHVPWWARGGGMLHGRGMRFGGGTPALLRQSFQGQTDSAGKHHLQVDLGQRALPVTIQAESSVQDVNRQSWSGSASLLVHPADAYVGLRLTKPYVPAGKDLSLDALVVDLDGKAVAGRPVELIFERLSWRWKRNTYEQIVADSKTKTLQSTDAAQRVSLKAPTGGQWRITATVRDAEQRPCRTVTTVWVAGGKKPSAREVEEEQVTLIPDAETYGGGDTAKVLVIAPFTPAEGLLTLRRSGLTKTVRFRMSEATKVLEVPIADGMVPGVLAHVALVGAAPREDSKKTRPAYASGSAQLKVPPTRRALTVTVTPAKKELAPGAKTSASFVVRDHEGKPVAGAQIALAVVDEAVLSLAGHEQPDPLGVFYGPRPPSVSDHRARTLLRLQTLQPEAELKEAGAAMDSAMEGAAPPAPGGPARGGRRMRQAAKNGLGDGGGGQAPPPIELRKDLRPLAVFDPDVRTDAKGQARLDYELPDSLTRFRLVAVAAAGDRSFGSDEDTLTARLPLMVRPSPPRFLNFGDTCELPVVIQNQTDAALQVQVALRASNLKFTAGQGRTLTIPAKNRREVRFPVAAELAGTAKLQVAASAGDYVDAQELSFPVWTPATSEAFATYGSLTGNSAGITQPVAPPKDAWPEYGGLEITTSSTGLQALTDAVIYLSNYPYGCAEQISSRIIALVAIKDVLAAFDAEGLPSAAGIQAQMTADLTRLKRLQNSDNGWGWWRRGERSWPYLTVHVVHALVRAADKDYPQGLDAAKRALPYLRQIERHIPKWYSASSRRALVAYSLYVRRRMGDADVGKARKLLAEVPLEKHSMETLGWIYTILRTGAPSDAANVRRFFGNRVVETAGAANFTTSYSDGAHVLLHSARRVDGIILEALLEDPAELEGDLAPKLMRGLLAHRTRGRWYNTQENAFILLALDRYFRTAEKVTPDFVARAWLGDDFAGEHAFKGRTTERARIDVPMSWLQKAGDRPLVLAKDGPGRLYYRIGMRYAPRDLKLPALDAGFTVERRYEPVDAEGDVRQDDDGTWRIKAGTRVRVRVTMLAPTRRYHVALVDPLPAGLEPLDPALRATGSLPADPQAKSRGRWWWWSRTWYEHSGLRDERAEAFTSLLWEGMHTYSYVTRATTPGTFVAPPAKAEEMYAPETFGRSATDRVIVE